MIFLDWLSDFSDWLVLHEWVGLVFLVGLLLFGLWVAWYGRNGVGE